MTDYQPPLEDIRFVLEHVAELDKILTWPGYDHTDTDLTFGILDEAGRFMADLIAPLNRIGDLEGPTLHADGSVTLPDGYKEAYARFVAAGWNGVKSPTEYGGHGFPVVVGMAVQEMLTTAAMAFSLCPMLTQSAALAVERHAPDDQKAAYLDKLISGQWAGTMVLTEPEAGSDLGAIRTRAVPQDDGSWRIFGTKIFITWGEHDLAENIIHLMMARAPEAPAGTGGLSLFIVPKYLPTAEGETGARNDVTCVSLEHKIGIHGSPTCVMAFGENEGAVGYLAGNVHSGMPAMFTMMNDARLYVGLQGLGISERAYQKALTFARERRQGQAPGGDRTDSVPIIDHPDVQRMLLTMRAHIEAMRGLIYDTAARLDGGKRHPEATTRKEAAAVGRLLTPIAKAWCTDIGVEMTSIGIQIHGGMGYIEETGAGQLWRDSRIAPIYEGTNGIQAIDLTTRKLPEGGGAVVRGYLAEIAETAAEAGASGGELAVIGQRLAEAASALSGATEWLLAAGDAGDVLAGSSPYLRMFGTVAGGYSLAKAAIAATRQPSGTGFLTAKVATARFYAEQILPQANSLMPAVTAGSAALASFVPSEPARTS